MTYWVNHWGSHPDAGNDDCNMGEEFPTLEAAKASQMYAGGTCFIQYIELDGPDVYEVRLNPHYSAKECRLDDSLEHSEFAHQQGMAFGIDAYNEAMGWDTNND